MHGRNKIRKLAALAGEESGAEIVEFAVSISLFFMALLGVIGFANAVYVYHFVTWGAQQGTRYAIVHGADFSSTACSSVAPPAFAMKYNCEASSTDVQNYVRSTTPGGINVSSIAVNTTWPATTPDCTSGCTACSPAQNAGCLVNVQVTYTFDFSLGFLPKSALSLTGTSERVIEE
jgi:Flp pilus assembly protein TadG